MRTLPTLLKCFARRKHWSFAQGITTSIVAVPQEAAFSFATSLKTASRGLVNAALMLGDVEGFGGFGSNVSAYISSKDA